jgi:hypothetical protein
MDNVRLASRSNVDGATKRKMSTGMARRPVRGLLLVLVSVGASGCADHFCGAPYPYGTDLSCSTYKPMQPSYFPAIE